MHINIEDALKARIGEPAGRLHTARSRNDQVALDLRLYLRDQITWLMSDILALAEALIDKSENVIDLVMPGYTHLQRAQPVRLSHHLMAYFQMFRRDWQRLADARVRMDEMPLGSAALAGTTFPIDRESVAAELGFSRPSANSMDAVSDRDFAAEFLFDASMVMMHLSRLSEELVMWSTQEFGFCSLPDEFCSGSSIMPQKKNPDACELIRGKTGRVYGDLIALLTTLKALPLTYNKDLQEDKEPVFDAVDTVRTSVRIMSGLIPGIQVQRGPYAGSSVGSHARRDRHRGPTGPAGTPLQGSSCQDRGHDEARGAPSGGRLCLGIHTQPGRNGGGAKPQGRHVPRPRHGTDP